MRDMLSPASVQSCAARATSLSRRALLRGAPALAVGLTATDSYVLAQAPPRARTGVRLIIKDVELTEVHGHYMGVPTVDAQPEVTPLAIYDGYKAKIYEDKPGPEKSIIASAIYLHIRTDQGIEGIYGPIDREAAFFVSTELRRFLIVKDALAGEALWDQMYRSNRHSRAGAFLMAISAVDNTLWDLRGRYYGVPVYRLLSGPTRESIEAYSSTLGFSLQPDAMQKRAVALKDAGFRNQKWFMPFGLGDGPEGIRRNVDMVRLLREAVGEDVELMFDSFSGWDLTYALEWAHQVEKYHSRWMEEFTHPEKIVTFAPRFAAAPLSPLRRGSTSMADGR